MPHFDFASLTAAHDVGVIDPGGQDGVFVFKGLQALPSLYIPCWKAEVEREVGMRRRRGMKSGYSGVPHLVTEATTSRAHHVRPR